MIKSQIINLIEINYGLKGIDVVKKIMGIDLTITYNEIMDIIFDMIQAGEIVEIELVFPNHVSKSFLIPRNTSINVVRKR